MATADTIYIRDLVFDAIIGVLPIERTTPQPICINLEVTVNTQTAARSRDLKDTLDYAALAEAVKHLTIKAECLLVETLAAQIAELALAQPMASAVLVDINKPNALADAAGVGVRIYRER
jgi:dihydroneopterin aldolase